MPRSTGKNWKRGLFRLWLVVSVVWIAFVFLLMRPDQAVSHLERQYRDRIEQLDESVARAERRVAAARALVEAERAEENLVTEAKRRLAASLAQRARVEGGPSWTAQAKIVREALLQGLAVPFALFVAGLTGFWVARGFGGDRDV